MSSGHQDRNISELDDLTLIKGIGQTRQDWLHDKLNVYTYHDLATLSADDMEAELKADNQIVSHSKIEGWIEQARRLAGASSPQIHTLVKEKGWQPFASFVIEFQEHEDEGQEKNQRTCVHHVEADQTRTWAGIEHRELCQWMVSQLGDKVSISATSQTAPPLPDESRLQKYLARAEQMTNAAANKPPQTQPAQQIDAAIANAAPAPNGNLQARITAVQAFQPPEAMIPAFTCHARQDWSGCLNRNELFTLKVDFEMHHIGETPITYTIQVYARSLQDGSKMLLGSAQPTELNADQDIHSANLPEVMLQNGVYRLDVILRFEAGPALCHFEVPALQVI